MAFLLLGLSLTLACQARSDRTPRPPLSPVITQEDSYRIAAFLPLSGRLRSYGTEALQGIQLALSQAKLQPGLPPVELVLKDSASGEHSLRDRLEDVIRESNPIAVIGPMFSREVEAVARLSQQLEIPVITPSATLSDVHRLSPYVFSTALTFGLQAQGLADYAITQSGYRRLVIVAPQSGFGRELARLFKEEVQKHGGEIVAEEFYPESVKDFGSLVKHLKSEDLKREGKQTTYKSAQGGSKTIYRPGFDAIFLPDDYLQVVLIAAQLRFHNIKVALLGSNSWNTADRARFPEPALMGGVFVDSFFAESPDPSIRDLVQRCRMRYGTQPSMFMVHAYEATSVILEAIRHGATSGKQFRKYLEHSGDIQALAGPAGFGSEGVLNRRLFVLQVNEHGKLRMLR